MAGFDELNKRINDRIQEISIKLHENTASTREYNEISELIYPKLKYHIWKFCKDEYDTAEALHFTLLKVFKNVSQYNPNAGRFTTWAFTIARNETLYYLDRKHKSIPKYIEIGELYENHDSYSSDGESDAYKQSKVISDMHDKTIFEIFNLKDELLKNIAIDKMLSNDKVKEIAIKYDLKENTVKTKLRKARFEIRKAVLKNNPSINQTLIEVIPGFKIKSK